MNPVIPVPPGGDPFCLNRFLEAQEPIYNDVLEELKRGRKRTHWMWFVFPQFAGLGHSWTAERYAVRSAEEARQYLRHPVLGSRLEECCQVLLAVQGRSVAEIFGFPDDLKLKSSMTLFGALSPTGSTFSRVLDRYFHGDSDEVTLQLLRSDETKGQD